MYSKIHTHNVELLRCFGIASTFCVLPCRLNQSTEEIWLQIMLRIFYDAEHACDIFACIYMLEIVLWWQCHILAKSVVCFVLDGLWSVWSARGRSAVRWGGGCCIVHVGPLGLGSLSVEHHIQTHTRSVIGLIYRYIVLLIHVLHIILLGQWTTPHLLYVKPNCLNVVVWISANIYSKFNGLVFMGYQVLSL